MTVRPGFKYLDTHTPERAMGGLYYAIRLIRHRTEILNLERGHFIEGVASEPSIEERALGLVIVKEIEEVERVPLNRLNERKAQNYLSKLSDITEEQAGRAFGHNKKRGRDLLEGLRNTSSGTTRL